MREYPYYPEPGEKTTLSLGLTKEQYRGYEIYPNHGRSGGFNLWKGKEKISGHSFKTEIDARLAADQLDGVYDKKIKELGLVEEADGWHKPTDKDRFFSLHWNDYCLENKTETLYFINADKTKLIMISEGSGEALEQEDTNEGYVDYWYANVYFKDGSTSGGFMFLKEVIKAENETIKDIVVSIIANESAFDDVDLENCEIVDPYEGEFLEEEFEEYVNERIRSLRAEFDTEDDREL